MSLESMMGQKDTKTYMQPFYAPRLKKWVITERTAIQNARRNEQTTVPLYLFDDKEKADEFFFKLANAVPECGTVH